MMIEIRSRRSGSVLFSLETSSLKLAVEAAVKSQANLREANLYGANLYGANLREADLREANLYGADLREANLYGANLRGADLGAANLYGANLRGANLRGADLRGADLREAKNADDVRLETGETLAEYRAVVVPALLAAGGHQVPEDAWQCHAWDNCPMAAAFAVHRVKDIPLLYRPRVEQFVRLFDAGLISAPQTGEAPA